MFGRREEPLETAPAAADAAAQPAPLLARIGEYTKPPQDDPLYAVPQPGPPPRPKRRKRSASRAPDVAPVQPAPLGA